MGRGDSANHNASQASAVPGLSGRAIMDQMLPELFNAITGNKRKDRSLLSDQERSLVAGACSLYMETLKSIESNFIDGRYEDTRATICAIAEDAVTTTDFSAAPQLSDYYTIGMCQMIVFDYFLAIGRIRAIASHGSDTDELLIENILNRVLHPRLRRPEMIVRTS